MKKIITYLLLISFALAFVSCHNNEDPFIVSTNEAESLPISTTDTSDTSKNNETTESAGNSTSPQAQPGPEEEFYSFSASEAYQKYGLFAPDIDILQACDGEHIYVTDRNQILWRSDYPSGENQRPACTDPLCTHQPGSTCPLGNLRSMFSMACYGDKLFYIGKDDKLYAYTPETNHSESILKNCSRAVFHRYSGKLYLINPESGAGFNSINCFYQISENAEAIKIGSVEKQFSNGFFVHSESTVVGFDLEAPDGSSPAIVVLYDTETKESKTVFERFFSELPGNESDRARIVPMSIFGDKVLFSVGSSYQVAGETTELSEIWLVDVITGEKRLLTTTHSLQLDSYCLYSEKYVCTVDRRDKETDHYVIRILDPYSGEESAYDLSEMAASIGETIPLTDCHLSTLNRFVPLLDKTYWIPYTAVNNEGEEYTAYSLKRVDYLAFDLESGRVFKYPQPDPSELSA